MDGKGNDMNITLAFAPGTCSRVPMIALEEAGVPYEARLIRFMKGEHRSPDYLALNPAGKVPALIVDGKPLAQNIAILTYLARSFPGAGLLPLTGDAYRDAALLSRLAWFSADLHQLVARMRLPEFSCDLPDTAERIRNMAAAAMATQLTGVEADLARKPWLLGDDWSVLDAYLHWVWWRITGAGFPQDRFPNIAAHNARMEARPAVQRTLAREADALAQLEAEGLMVHFPEPPAIVLDLA
jgi:glutathione S-transferase